MYHSTVPWIQVDLADPVHPEHLEAPEQMTLKIVKKQKMKKINAKMQWNTFLWLPRTNLKPLSYLRFCIRRESTICRQYFCVSYWRRNNHFTWSSEPHIVLAVFRERQCLHSQLFKDLKYGSGSRNRTGDLPLCRQEIYRLSWSCRRILTALPASPRSPLTPLAPAGPWNSK